MSLRWFTSQLLAVFTANEDVVLLDVSSLDPMGILSLKALQPVYALHYAPVAQRLRRREAQFAVFHQSYASLRGRIFVLVRV